MKKRSNNEVSCERDGNQKKKKKKKMANRNSW